MIILPFGTLIGLTRSPAIIASGLAITRSLARISQRDSPRFEGSGRRERKAR